MLEMNFTRIKPRLLRSALLLWAAIPVLTVAAGQLAPGLRVDPPDNLSIQYENLEVLNGKPALVGYVEGAPAYFVAAETVNAGVRAEALWAKLESGLKRESDDYQIHTLGTGSFQTQEGHPVRYRAYRYTKQREPHQQIFYLVRSEDSAYWIYVTAIESLDLQVILPLVKAVVRRATLVAAVPGPLFGADN
jgi:hypothetical protein